MAWINLRDYQADAVKRMHNGCILCGGVGSGKSMTSIAYYYDMFGGDLNSEKYVRMKNPADLYIITTAKKRDSLEWESELSRFLLSSDASINPYSNSVHIDSWNNIQKYKDVKDAFFIFDEQRVVGYGAWTKAFLKIAEHNLWVLLSATPGDTWSDYVPVFIANGYFKTKSEFEREHVIYKRFSKFPQIDRYIDTDRLVRLRSRILVTMDFKRDVILHHEDVVVDYNKPLYNQIMRDRWNIFEDRPLRNAGEMCQTLRRLVNTDESRAVAIAELAEKHPRMIIFYNFDYELAILKAIYYGDDVEVAEWNGHKHQPVPETNSWIYLVQYNAGSEGWNCIKTDTMVFYSENYSYKMMEQASGRINRMNTMFKDLYYYHIRSYSLIDIAIRRSITNKKIFTESGFIRKRGIDFEVTVKGGNSK